MNNKKLAAVAAMCAVTTFAHAQWTTVGSNTTTNDNVGIGTTSPSFKLEVSGTTLAQKTIGINGMPLIYLPDQSSSVFNGSVAFGNGLRFLTSPSGKANTAVGINAGLSITSGESNTATGYDALRNTTTAFANAAFGIYALRENVGGGHNAAFGGAALQNNISGSQNSAVGSGALFYTTGYGNTGSGFQVLFNNTSGYWNTGLGSFTLNNNTTGAWNTAIGASANTITGTLSNATAIGARALVGKSDAISLGDTTKPTLVGIGTAYPGYQLDVRAAADPVRLTGLQAGDPSDYMVTVNSAGVLRKMPAGGGGGSVTGAGQGTTLDGSTVVLGDYCGKGGGTFKKDREINMGGYNLYFNSSEKGKLYMGAEQCKDLVTRLEIGAKGLDPVNGYDPDRPSPSGLRFTDLTAQSDPIENKYKGVLSLDEDGDVIWVRECCFKEKPAVTTEEYQDLKNTVETLKAEIAELRTALKQAQLTDNAPAAQNMLYQNIPNPSDAGTNIGYMLAGTYDDAFIAVYNIDGKMMKKIPLSPVAGKGMVSIDIASWATGSYTYSLFTNGRIQDTKKLQIVR